MDKHAPQMPQHDLDNLETKQVSSGPKVPRPANGQMDDIELHTSHSFAHHQQQQNLALIELPSPY